MPHWACAVFSILILTCPVSAQDSENLDVRIFRGINGRQDPSVNGFPEYLDYTSFPTFAALPVGFVVVGAVAGDRAVFEAGLLSMTAQLTSLGLTVALKEIVGRPRPFETLSDVRVKHQWSATGFSFPSGHTSQAFAIATVFSLRFPRGSVIIPCFVWASAIGYGRIFLGLHYPSDVIGGALVGMAGGIVAWSLRGEARKVAERAVAEQRLTEAGFPKAEIVRIQIPF